MPSLVDLTGKEHLSNSSISQWLRCPESFYLERVAGRPSTKGWAMYAGMAIHRATEMLDIGQETDTQQAWDNAWSFYLNGEIAALDEPPRAGGKRTKEWPNGEDDAFWAQHGPLHVQTWIRWRDERLAEGWTLLGVEQKIDVELSGRRVVGSIDRLLADPHGQLAVLDLKSGQAPKSPTQLAIYAAALEASGEPRPVMGGYFLTKTGVVDWQMLGRYTPQVVGAWFEGVARGIESQIFVPNPSTFCSVCGVRRFCSVFGDAG